MPKKISKYYLFTGYLHEQDGKIRPVPGSLEPVRNRVVFTKNPSAGNGNGQALKPLKTRENGVLYPLPLPFNNDVRTLVHTFGKKHVFHVPPQDVLMYTWAAQGESWSQALSDFFQGREGIELSRWKLRKHHVKAPDDESDDDYKTWYAAEMAGLRDDEPFWGFVLPRVRAAFLVFSGPEFDGARVEVVSEKGKKFPPQIAATTGGICSVLLHGNREDLEPGFYTIKVTVKVPIDNKDRMKWSSSVEKNSYQLTERLRFNITNVAGEFDIVNCDPISVEEAMMTQFPTHFAHLIAAAKKAEHYPTLSLEQEIDPLPDAVEKWAKRLAWTWDKQKFAVDLINADAANHRMKALAEKLFSELDLKNEIASMVQKSVVFAFRVFESYEAWDEFVKIQAAAKSLKGIKEITFKTLESMDVSNWTKAKWWNHIKKASISKNPDAKILQIDKLNEASRKALLKAGIPEKQTRLAKMIGAGRARALSRGIVALDTAVNVAQIALDGYEWWKTWEELEKTLADLDLLLQQYQELFPNAPSREGIGTLERYRAASVEGEIGYDNTRAKTIDASIDMVLSALLLVPVAQEVAGLIMLVQATGDLFITAGEYFDKYALDGFFAEAIGNHKVLLAHQSAAYANQELMQERLKDIGNGGGASDLHTQLRVRSEALYGLVALIARAAMSDDATDDAGFLKKVKEYRIEEYIERFVLNDQWQLPAKPLVPVSLDTHWLYSRSLFGQYADLQTYANHFGSLKEPLLLGAVAGGTLGMSFAIVANEVMQDNVKANFQRRFPIHRLDAKSITDFVKAFRTVFPRFAKTEIDDDHTCIYTRRYAHSRWVEADAEKIAKRGHLEEWQPLNWGAKDVDELDAISPYEQIRVLIVLKENVAEGLYPISIQLVRLDLNNVDGPKYKGIVKKLRYSEDKSGKPNGDLLPEEKTLNGRLGYVCYPFFQLGNETIPGTKPMANWSMADRNPRFYYGCGLLTDMRYGFKVSIGAGGNPPFIKIGAMGHRPTKLDEFRVSCNLQRRPEENKLLVRDFLTNRTTQSPRPELFSKSSGGYDTAGHGVGPIWIRVGGEGHPYRLPSADEDGNVVFPTFNWNDPVEFILVVWTPNLKKKDYETLNLDWKRVPIEFKLKEYGTPYITWNTDGPTYRSTLKFMGQYTPFLGRYRQLDRPHGSFNSEGGIEDPTLEPAVRLFNTSDAQIDSWIDPGEPSHRRQTLYWIYGAHFKLDYETPSGKLKESLRPFSSRLLGPNEYFRVGIHDIVSAPRTGVDVSHIEVPKAFREDPDVEFHFRAPVDYMKDVPWADTKDLTKIEKWITERGMVRNQPTIVKEN